MPLLDRRFARAVGCEAVRLSALLQLKRGNARDSIQVALQLVQSSHQVEVQHFGYTVLQHVVGRRSSTCICTTKKVSHSVFICTQLEVLCILLLGHSSTALQVGARWEEFTAEEHTQLASTSFALLTQGALLGSIAHYRQHTQKRYVTMTSCWHGLYAQLQGKPAPNDPFPSSDCITAQMTYMLKLDSCMMYMYEPHVHTMQANLAV